MPSTIDQLIINGPYDEPLSHWRYERESRTFTQVDGRRPAGYVAATPGACRSSRRTCTTWRELQERGAGRRSERGLPPSR